MTAYFCSDRGTWSTEECPMTCDGDPHQLRHVGPDKVVQLMNAVESAALELRFGAMSAEDVSECLDWMSAHNRKQLSSSYLYPPTAGAAE